MANRHMKRYSISLIITEMQIKTDLLWGITSLKSGWLSLKSAQITNVREGVEKKEHLHIVGGNVVGIATMENSMEVP